MSYVRHTAIIVTAHNRERLEVAHAKALELFADTGPTLSSDVLHRAGLEGFNPYGFYAIQGQGLAAVTDITTVTCNTVCSFMIAPDGSKVGWSHADLAEITRKVFISWLHSQRDKDDLSSYLTWAEVDYDDPAGDMLRQTNRSGVELYDLDRLLAPVEEFILKLRATLKPQRIPDDDRNIPFVNLGLLTVDYSARPRTGKLTAAGLIYRRHVKSYQ